jgi:hypothetical protein
MSGMHLMNAGFTTLNTKKSNKKKSAKQLKAELEHEQWLKKNGVHSTQLTGAKDHKISLPSYKTDKNDLSNTIVDGGRDKSIMANLYKEDEATRRAILEKASRVAPLYNKGGLQLITSGMSLKDGNGRGKTT